MGTEMVIRDLYLPANTTIDLAAARATASRLCQHAGHDDLRVLLNEEWISGEVPTNVDSRTGSLSTADEVVDPWTDEWLTEHTARLRTRAEQALQDQLDHFAWHLDGRDVCRYRFDNGENAGVDHYVTGGPTMGDDPTEAYGAWDIVCDVDRFPPGWPQQIGAAAGLIHPHGGGRPMATVTFHVWA